ncbi:MAG: hypothetical protein FJ280_29685 [Planctomycetes bacterium]|nr:hypothetical protein [Planctomycetota bacterium]
MAKKSANRVAARIDWERRRDDWLVKLRELMDSIKTWAERRRWFVDEHEKTIEEDDVGKYTVPTLFIQAPSGKIVVEPIGCNIIGAQGRVDIESFPSLNRLLLILVDGEWKIKTDSRIEWPEPWSEQSFINLVKALTSAA